MPIPVRKTLLVGVGGFGKATLRTLRRKLYENYGCLHIPAFEYLVLDTDNDPAALMYKNSFDSLDRQAGFTEDEFVNISCDRKSLQKLYDSNITSDVENSLKWFDGKNRDLGVTMLENGAGGIRSFGKLAFILAYFDEKKGLIRKVQKKLLNLYNLSPNDASWDDVKKHFILDTGMHSERIDIYLFSSTAGGTGSGTFIDLSFFILNLFKNKKIDQAGTADYGERLLYLYLPNNILEDDTTNAVFKPPEVIRGFGFSPQELVKAGSYAALSELEHFQLKTPSQFRFDAGHLNNNFFIPDWQLYQQINRPKKEINRIFEGEIVFDWVYLVGNRSAKKLKLKGAEDAIDMTADKICMRLVERQNDTLLKMIEANKQHYGSIPVKIHEDQGQNQKDYSRLYSGFGLSKIYIGTSMIKRWAANYLAGQFIDFLIDNNPPAKSEMINNVRQIWSQFHWHNNELFVNISENVLQSVRNSFYKLNNSDSFSELIHSGVNFKEESSCFGNASELDAAYSQWNRNFKSKKMQELFESILEKFLIENGIQATETLLTLMIKQIETDIGKVKENLKEDVQRFEDLTADCHKWIYMQRNKLDWLGSHNQPGDNHSISNCLVLAANTLKHISELNEIPDYASKRIKRTLINRFGEVFLHERTCGVWRDNLIRSSSIKSTEAMILELKDGLLLLFKEILKRVKNAQTQILQFLLEKKAIIVSHPTKSNKSLKITLNEILYREDKSNPVGIKQEMKALSNKNRNMKDRNIYCGMIYHKKGMLENPAPDNVLMADLMKSAFSIDKEINRLWDIIKVSELDNATKNWITLLIEKNLTQLKVKPALIEYYKDKEKELKDDIDHCLKHCDSYLGYTEGKFGSQRPTSPTSYIFSPEDLHDLAQKSVNALTLEQKPQINTYQGNELIFLSTVDGVPLPLINDMKALSETYQTFPRKEALWTRSEHFELIAYEDNLDAEAEIYLGIILGTIWYNKADRSFRMNLERRGYEGAPRPIPIGKSIKEVLSFFKGTGPKLYIEPDTRLKDANNDHMMSLPVLLKLMPLLHYYEKIFFSDVIMSHDTQDFVPEHYKIVKQIEERRTEMFSQLIPSTEEQHELNNESDILCEWLHAYCEIIPIHKDASTSLPNKDWLPVLMRNWNEDASKKFLLWHNRNIQLQTEKKVNKNDQYRYAVCSRIGEDPESAAVIGWNTSNPLIIPEHIREMLWNEPDTNEDGMKDNAHKETVDEKVNETTTGGDPESAQGKKGWKTIAKRNQSRA